MLKLVTTEETAGHLHCGHKTHKTDIKYKKMFLLDPFVGTLINISVFGTVKK